VAAHIVLCGASLKDEQQFILFIGITLRECLQSMLKQRKKHQLADVGEVFYPSPCPHLIKPLPLFADVLYGRPLTL